MFDQGLRRRSGPATIGHGVRGTRMRHLGILDQHSIQGLASPCLGITSYADHGADAEGLDDDPQELVALLVHGRHDLVRQFLRDDVATLLGVLEEQERAVIVHKVIGEEGFRLPEALLKKPPEPAATDLRTVTGEPGHLLTGMLFLWPPDRHLQPHPVPDGGDLPERHAGLGHPEGSGIHAQEEHLLRPRGRVASQIGLVRGPGVVQRLVDEVGRRRKGSSGQSLP